MSLTYQRPEINTFQDLATNPNYQLTTFKGSTAEVIFLVTILLRLKNQHVLKIITKYDHFKESKSGPMKDIGDKLRRCDDDTCSPNDIDKVVRTVLVKDRMVAILVRP